jgi:cytochrome oxidase Cu insertion factor (SCO1/SenC/PrrC family)
MRRRKRDSNEASRPARLKRRRLIAASIVAIAAMAVMLAIIGPRRATNAAPTRAAGRPTDDSYAAPVQLKSIDGKQISLPAGRPGMVMLSSSLCTTCFLTVRDMGTLEARLAGRVDAAFISVDPGDSPATLADRRASIGDPPIPFAIDTTGTLAGQYHITTLGTVVVYDAAGKIVQRSIEPTLADLQAALRGVGV